MIENERARDGLGGGVQDRSTPQWLVNKVEQRFGVLFALDLAASEENKKCKYYINEQSDSRTADWAAMLNTICDGNVPTSNIAAWLNPPFKRVSPWMEKCADQSKHCKIVTLTLASLDSNWYRDFVEPNAMSFILRDRITFVGMPEAFNKACMISLWGFDMKGLAFWQQGVA